MDAGREAYMSKSSAAPTSSASHSSMFIPLLAMGLQFTSPLKLYFRSCCLQCQSSLLSNTFKFGASTVFDGRLFHSLPFTFSIKKTIINFKRGLGGLTLSLKGNTYIRER